MSGYRIRAHPADSGQPRIRHFPVASFDEYTARVPEDRKDWKLVPVDPRPFPDQLRDRPMEHAALSDAAGGTLGMRGLMIVLAAPVALWHRGVKAGRAAAP